MTLKSALLPLGILAGAVVLSAGFLMTRSLLAQHQAPGTVVWSQSAGDGTVFPACGSAGASLPTCANGAQVEISWEVNGVHYGGIKYRCDDVTITLNGQPVFTGQPCSGSYTFTSLSSNTSYSCAVQARHEYPFNSGSVMSDETYDCSFTTNNCTDIPPDGPTCPNGSAAPNGQVNQCTCAQGNVGACPSSGGLSLNKTELAPGPGATVRPGDLIQYRMNIPAVQGDQSWLDVHDHLPAHTTLSWQGGGMQYKSSDQITGGVDGNGDIWWQQQLAPSGWSGYVDFNVTVNADAPDGAQICNAAVIRSQNIAASNSNTVCNTVSNPPPPSFPDLIASIPDVYNGSVIAGGNITLEGTISNIGAGTITQTFANSFEVDRGNDGVWDFWIDNNADMIGLSGTTDARNNTRLTTAQWNNLPAGTHTVRLCADLAQKNNWVSKVNESNERNNCGPSMIITVTAPPVCSDGTPAPNGDIDQCPGSSDLPDLTAGSVSPASTIVGAATQFSATITNRGRASTGAGFGDLFQKADNLEGTGAQSIGTFANTALAAEGSRNASVSTVFTSSGTYYLRACADRSSAGDTGVITESNENNNCGGWTAVNVTIEPPIICPNGDPAPNDDTDQCTCKQGNSSKCTATLCPNGDPAPDNDRTQCLCDQGNIDACTLLCPNGDIAPGADPQNCSCAQGNVNKCPLLCPNGEPAPENDPAQCTCEQGNVSACVICSHEIGQSCTSSPNNCSARNTGAIRCNGTCSASRPLDTDSCGPPDPRCVSPNSSCPPPPGPGPACVMVTAPMSTTAGSQILFGWGSACDSRAAGCTRTVLGLPVPVVAAGTHIDQVIGNTKVKVRDVNPSSGNSPQMITVGAVPATYTLTGHLNYWPTSIPVPGSDYPLCPVNVGIQVKRCLDGSPAPGNDLNRCPRLCERAGFPRCSAGTPSPSVEYLDASCRPQIALCQWASRRYGCVGGKCLTPPDPTGSFDINPKLVRSGSKANITWNIGPETSCKLTATNADNTSGIMGNGGRPTKEILGQTTYTLDCVENITGDRLLPPLVPIVISVVPTFQEK